MVRRRVEIRFASSESLISRMLRRYVRFNRCVSPKHTPLEKRVHHLINWQIKCTKFFLCVRKSTDFSSWNFKSNKHRIFPSNEQNIIIYFLHSHHAKSILIFEHVNLLRFFFSISFHECRFTCKTSRDILVFYGMQQKKTRA